MSALPRSGSSGGVWPATHFQGRPPAPDQTDPLHEPVRRPTQLEFQLGLMREDSGHTVYTLYLSSKVIELAARRYCAVPAPASVGARQHGRSIPSSGRPGSLSRRPYRGIAMRSALALGFDVQ